MDSIITNTVHSFNLDVDLWIPINLECFWAKQSWWASQQAGTAFGPAQALALTAVALSWFTTADDLVCCSCFESARSLGACDGRELQLPL